MSRRSSGSRLYQMGDPELSKMTLYGLPPPPRLSIKIGSGSALAVAVVILMAGKSLGTETPLGFVTASGLRWPPVLIKGLCGNRWLVPKLAMLVFTVADALIPAFADNCRLPEMKVPELFALLVIAGPPVHGDKTSPGMTSDGAVVGCPGFAQPTARLSPPAPSFCSAST